ncbi:MAG: hypothetical protein R3C25_08150 [Hyphomonadaceae bacterium]
MLWIDCQSYFGPDRRRKHGGVRLRERRRYDCAGNPPPLPTALRQLRLRVIEARGPGALAFRDRAHALAMLAHAQNQLSASDCLSSLAMLAGRGQHNDVRPALYEQLGRVHAALEATH